MRSTLYILSLLLLLSTLPTFIYGQAYNVNRYSIEEGLPQSQVRAIVQDSKGYIWFGTHRGLSRFDGKNFQNYDLTDSLPGNFVSDIYEDSKGNMWFGTDQGASRYTGGKFHKYTRQQGLPTNEILSITEDYTGRIWMGTSKGASVQKQQKGKRKYLWESVLPHYDVNTILRGRDDKIWLGTENGIFIFEDGTLSILSADAPSQGFEVYNILRASNGKVWIASNQGVWHYQDSTIVPLAFSKKLPHPTVYCITEDINGDLWFGTKKGVVRYTQDDWQVFTEEEGFPATDVRSSMLDREGNLWFGTDGGGVYKVTRGIFSSYSVEEGLSGNIAKSFLEDANGNIWVSTYDRGTNALNLSTQQVKEYHPEQGLAGNDISYSYKDSKNRFWFATYSNGISLYQNNRFTNISIDDGLPSNTVYCITEDQQNRIWFGTKQGISIWDGQTYKHYSQIEGLINPNVYTIIQARDGSMWIGTQGGVSQYQKGEFTNFTVAEGLADNFVISMLQDTRGRIWMGTGNGVSVYDGKEFLSFNIDDMPGANLPVAMVEESEQYIWAGTNNGIYRIDAKSLSPNKQPDLTRYSKTDGLPSLECNGNAAFKDSKGNLWFGTIEGAVMCSPARINREIPLEPLTHITNLRLFRELVDWKSYTDSLDHQTGLPYNLHLPFNKNYLTFDFIGISLKNPLEVTYHFMLEGFDADWLPKTYDNNATYSNLPPGTYSFKVQASNAIGIWNREPATFTFTILPPYWETWWFRLLMVLLVLLIAAGVTYIILYRIRQEKEKRQMQFQAEKLELEHQALYAMMNPHFTFNALQSIQYYIHRQDRIAANKFLSSFAKLIRKNLESTQHDFISLSEEMERLRLYLSLEKMRFQDMFEYTLEVDPEVPAHEILLPPMILQPYVENSIKHGIMPLANEGKEGEIYVSITRPDDNHLKIQIEDNGIGIEASKKLRSLKRKDHTSRGMEITRARLDLFSKITNNTHSVKIMELKGHDGSVQGTLVDMTLPLHKG